MQAQRQHVSAILRAIKSCARYPADLEPSETVPEETVLVTHIPKPCLASQSECLISI